MLNKRKGQSTVEYIVLVSAVIAVAVAFFLAPGNKFQNVLNTTYTDATDELANMNDRLINSQPLATGSSPAPVVGTPSTTQFCTWPMHVDQISGLCV